ncbi:cytochrome B [Lewinella sp. 4G2]|uniref:cytochrome B n=1 Tax=Lewinella sp. 4G2 TaxID=1803372 RepID=UPI0007B4C2B9|nr:cytochrome B [Lewinella sp. 4G2]OAV43283.1 cytochrome B [Lewinella sp. 4G2]
MDILYTAIQHAHSGLRWVVLILLVAAIIKAASKRRGGSVYPGKDSLALFAFISTHIQLLLGLVLYLWLSPKFKFDGDTMSNAVSRFYAVEHLVGMLFGIALITAGYIRAKKQAELNKGWKTIGTFYLFGLLVIVASIPWPFRELGAGWF